MKKLFKIIVICGLAFFLWSTTSVRDARLISKLTVQENLVSPVTSSYWELNGLDEIITYRDGGLRNDVDNVYADTFLASGTLDLTQLTNTLGEPLNLTGDVIMGIKFSLEDDAAASCTIVQGGSDPYPLLGATYSFVLKANQSLLFKCDTVLDVVASGAKTIDYASSNDSTVLSVMLISADSYY